MEFFTRQPALWIEVIRTGLLMAILFGLNLTTEQFGAVMVFIGAVALALVQSQVTPQSPANVDDLKKYIGKANPAVIDKAGVQIITSDKTIGLVIGLMLSAALLAGASVAVAAPPPQGDPSRFSTGLMLRGASYQTDEGQAGQAFDPGLAITYSGTQNFSLALSGDVNTFHDPWGGASLTLNSCAVGNNPGDNFRLSIGIGVVHYYGTVPAYITHKDTWRVPAAAAWVLARDGLKRPRIYAQGSLTVDPRNGNHKRTTLGILIPFTGGKQTVPSDQ